MGVPLEVPDPVVSEKARRRRFSAEYKLRILREVERCKSSGAVGAILRREGLYSSHVREWRRQRDRIARSGLAAQKRGPKRRVEDPRVKELEREIVRLRRRNERVEALLEIQKKGLRAPGHPPESVRGRRERLMAAAEEVARRVGVAPACEVLSVCRATLYRRRQPRRESSPRPRSPRALAPAERQAVLDSLHAERFVDKAPAQIWAELLDRGTYHCSIRTMYRILAREGELRERRDQLRHPRHATPRLLATGPNRVWSWDITKLLGPAKWTSYYLYVLLDIFSRYVVGWMVALREAAALAHRLIEESCGKQGIVAGRLTVHADRGSSMTSKPVALLLADLGITKTHGRPRVSNDNPYSEAQFKTLKYCPQFPDRFGGLEHARAFCHDFFRYYNTTHRHSGLALMTPESVHYGRTEPILAARRAALRAAYDSHPERFVRGVPEPKSAPSEVWINQPEPLLEVAGGLQ
ncbi:MAG: IS3 family transposase [Thermoanaerobaculia bacterium]